MLHHKTGAMRATTFTMERVFLVQQDVLCNSIYSIQCLELCDCLSFYHPMCSAQKLILPHKSKVIMIQVTDLYTVLQ